MIDNKLISENPIILAIYEDKLTLEQLNILLDAYKELFDSIMRSNMEVLDAYLGLCKESNTTKRLLKIDELFADFVDMIGFKEIAELFIKVKKEYYAKEIDVIHD